MLGAFANLLYSNYASIIGASLAVFMKYRNRPLYRVINDWNSLPQSIVDSPSVNDFKTLPDRHYSNCLFDFV